MSGKNVQLVAADTNTPDNSINKTMLMQATASKPLENTSDLDFSSSEFNSIDELDDNAGNYRSFQSLEGIVTSDMKHRENRKKLGETSNRSQPNPEEDEPEREFDDTSQSISPPASLTIISKGRLLIIDTNLDRANSCGEQLSGLGLSCTVCIVAGETGSPAAPTTSRSVHTVDSVAVSGSFGGFRAAFSMSDSEQTADERPLKFDTFDLILDFQALPSYTGLHFPLGYYTPGESASRLQIALTELPAMRGTFKKPQLCLLDANHCLQGKLPSHECLQCLDVCPVGAITAKDNRIEIDHYLCQGCGACSLICPADAIQQLNPPQHELLAEITDNLAKARISGIHYPTLLLSDEADDSGSTANGAEVDKTGFIQLHVDDICRIGLDVIMVALAYGAGRVILSCGQMLPEKLRTALVQQVELAKIIVTELHLPAECICLQIPPVSSESDENSVAHYLQESTQPIQETRSGSPADFSFQHDKRTLIRLAANHLSTDTVSGKQIIALPSTAPFGTVTIEPSCSLCMACVTICPAGALTAGGTTPQLSAMEASCHQCGLCAAVCPEKAITLQPRLLCDLEAAGTRVVLREEEPFRCVQCGKPFASQAMIKKLQDKLKQHWMYQSNRQSQRLRMCRSCSARDALSAGDYHQ